MSGIIAVYALVIAVLIAGDIAPPPGQHYSLFNGFMHLACGLSVGLSGLAAGYAIGVVGDMVKLARVPRILGEAYKDLGRAVVHAAVENFCWHGTDTDFW